MSLAQSSSVGAHSLIGSDSSVGDKGRVSASILGRGCVVGPGAVVEGSFLLANVRVCVSLLLLRYRARCRVALWWRGPVE